MLRTYNLPLVIIIICCEWSMVIKWRKVLQAYIKVYWNIY